MRIIALRFDASIPRDWEPVIWKACAAWEKSGKVKFVAMASKETIYFDRAILGNGQLAYRRPASETYYNVITFNVSKRLNLAKYRDWVACSPVAMPTCSPCPCMRSVMS